MLKFKIAYSNTKQLSNCYRVTSFTITSIKELSNKNIDSIREIGLIGDGQFFKVIKQNNNTTTTPYFEYIVEDYRDSSD